MSRKRCCCSAAPCGAKAKFVRALTRARAETETVVPQVPSDEQNKPDERLLRLANRFPEGAILEAYKEVERVLLELRTYLDMRPRANLRDIVQRLVEKGHRFGNMVRIQNFSASTERIDSHKRDKRDNSR
jgi:hypothetical protein